jgi:hypothetical protein
MVLRRQVVLALALTPGALGAQDAHYWTLQYGPRSSLLGGAVIGTVTDVSATYYNPGALALAADPAFAVSANVFELSGVTLEGGGGAGVDLGTSSSGLRPSLVAGTLARDLLGRDVLAYSALTRSRGSQDLSGALLLSGADVPPALQLEDVAAGVQFEGDFSDVWAGVSYAHAVGSHMAVGVTWYGAIRSQRRRLQLLSQGIAPDGTGDLELETGSGRYSTVRTLAKVGVSFGTGPVTAGVTMTTPSLHLFGSGELQFNRSMFGTDTTALAASVQTDLPAEYRSPLSVGGGFGVRVGASRLHVSAEWFDAIAPYDVMRGADAVAQQPPDTFAVDAVQALDDVVNWGVGLERRFAPSFSGFLSFAVDRSGLTDDVERAALSVYPFDISSVTGGADFSVGQVRLTLGAGYAWGREIDERLTEILRERDENLEATYVYTSLRLIFGFEITH